MLARTSAALALAVVLGASGCGAGKPPQGELREVMAKSVDFSQLSEADAAATNKVLDCYAEQMHSKLSPEGLKLVIQAGLSPDQSDELASKLSEKDQAAMAEVVDACSGKLVG